MPFHTRLNLSKLTQGITGGAPRGQLARGLSNTPPSGSVPFLRTLTADDFSTATTALIVGRFVSIGTFTVGNQQAAQFGFGSRSERNQGYVRVQLMTTGAVEFEGRVRFIVSNAQGTADFVVLDERTERLDGSSTDINQMVPLPATLPIALENSILDVRLNPDVANTFSPTASTFLIPITIWQ